MPTTLVIGMGISAVAYLQSAELKSNEMITSVGKPELWARMEGHHEMGQPTPLLSGNLLKAPHNFQEQPAVGKGFMLAKDFAALLDKHLKEKSTETIPGAWVEEISKLGSGYSVTIKPEGGVAFKRSVDKVVIAAGPGPNRPLMAAEDGGKDQPVDVEGMQGFVVGGTDFMSPTWALPDKKTHLNVAVYGGSATAAWAVELAMLRGFNVKLWFTRSADGPAGWDPAKRFSEAFPPGDRNTGVEHDTKDVRKVYKLNGVRFFPIGNYANFLELRLTDKDGKQIRQIVDLLIYALGSAHAADAGIRKILHPDLQSALVPFYDRNFAISSKPALLGVGTADRSLMIVGSAMSSAAGFNLRDLSAKLAQQGDITRDLAPYAAISGSLPAAARPTEGIAMVMAAAEALNTFMPVSRQNGKIKWDINFNTSNRTQLAAYLAQTTDLSPFAANLAVALIVSLRGQSRNPLGLTEAQVQFIVKRADWFADAQVKYNTDFETKRLADDKKYGTDWYLNVIVDLFTKDPEYIKGWQQAGINCG